MLRLFPRGLSWIGRARSMHTLLAFGLSVVEMVVRFHRCLGGIKAYITSSILVANQTTKRMKL